MTPGGNPELVKELLFGEGPEPRYGAPEPELLTTLAPFLSGELLDEACYNAGWALDARGFERPLGTELLRAYDAVARRLAGEGGWHPVSLERVFEQQRQPLARPVWQAATELARTLDRWSPIDNAALAPWAASDLHWQARSAEGNAQAALYAALLATEPSEDVVHETAEVAERLGGAAGAVLLAWCVSASLGTLRADLQAAAIKALRGQLADQPADFATAAAVALTAPSLGEETRSVAESVPPHYRDVGLLAEWLQQVLPEPPPERLAWLDLQEQLRAELEQLDESVRAPLLDACVRRIGSGWGAPQAAAVEGVPAAIEDTGEFPLPEATAAPPPPAPPPPRKVEGRPGLFSAIRAALTRRFDRREEDTAAEPPRVLNVALADTDREPLPEYDPLETEQDYLVRVDIGALAAESVVVNPVEIPTERLEPSLEGYRLDVLVASSDVDVSADLHRLFLPFSGPSWVCACETPRHQCSEDERESFLHIPFRTRSREGDATLRCTVYDRNNAVQSVRVEFAVGRGETERIRGVVDYSLAEDVGAASALEPRSMSVLTNEAADGTHTIVVNSGDRAIAVNLTEAEAGKALQELRAKLREITVGTNNTPSYDEQNRREPEDFLKDLKQLALLGSVLWGAVVPNRDDRRYLREQLQHRATIQIARVGKVVFPWALVYDIPRELGEQWTLCPLLDEWDTKKSELAAYPLTCPHENAHRANVLCPYGFWGFKHLIEQPPTVRQGVLPRKIAVLTPARAASARSHALDPALTEEHFTDLEGCLKGRFDLSKCDSRKALRKAFADPTLPLVYFYCHGKTAELAGTSLEVPFLEIGGNDKIGPNDFAAWDEDDKWGPAHWATTAPLVFINGCETTKLSPEDVVTFVDALSGMNAAGIVGTEIPVRQRVAGEVALRFYTQFAGQASATVGQALYVTRIDLLAKGNVSGLAYTPFCSMDLVLSERGN